MNLSYPEIKWNNEPIAFVPQYEYLGFIIDCNLSFEKHLSRCIQRVNSKSVILYKIRRYINTRIALQVYKSYIMPIMDYGDFLLMSCTNSSVAKLQKFQNRMLRLIVNPVNKLSNDDLHMKCTFYKPQVGSYICIFRLMFNLSLSNMLSDSATRGSTSYSFKLQLSKSAWYTRSVFYNGLKQWNALPYALRMIRDYRLLRKKSSSIC